MSGRMAVALAFLGVVPVAGGQENGNKMYWTDYDANKILRANRDGTNVEELVDTGSLNAEGIALDLIAGKIYWVGSTGGSAGKIQRANLDGSEVEDVLTDLGEVTTIALDPVNAKVYWTRDDVWNEGIYSVNMDGSNVEKLNWATSTGGIALDLTSDKIYWTDFERIQCAGLDGSDIEYLVTSGLDDPVGIDLDLGARKMYWCDARTAKIQRADLDGSNVEELITTGLVWPIGIALDRQAGKMYWTDAGADTIQRANLDGSKVEDLVTSGLQAPDTIALDVPPFPRLGIPVVSGWGMGLIACLLVAAGAVIIKQRDRGTTEMVRVSHPRKPQTRRHGIALMGICAAGLLLPFGTNAIAQPGYETQLTVESRDKLKAQTVGGNLTVHAAEPTCPDPRGLYAQCPNFASNGAEGKSFAYSDLGADLSAADNFTLEGQATIGRIRWWGTYLLRGSDAGCGPITDDDFTVLFWEDADGNPAGPSPVAIPAYTVTRAKQPVGTIVTGLGPDPVFEYELGFEETAFPPEPGQTYWVEVHNDLTNSSPCYWVWVTAPSPPGDGSSRQGSPSTDPDWDTATIRGFDLAFSLLHDPGLPIPAASQWGIIALALLLLTAATIVLRRNHPQFPRVQRERPHFPTSRGEAS